jgi:hypothetical protein
VDWSKKLFRTATPTTVPRLAPATKSESQWLVIEPPKTLDACNHPHQGLTPAVGATSQKVVSRAALAYPRTVAQFQTEHTLKAMPPIASKARRMNHLFTFGLLLAASLMAGGADWIRPGLSTNQPVWGLWGGLLWAVASGGFRTGEPRGLIKLGYPVLADKRYDLNQDYKETGFAPHRHYPLSRLRRTAGGGVLVAVSNDEQDPAAVYPFPNSDLWHYAGCKVTQYWAREAGAFRDDLEAVVNGRHTYWRSARPLPGGIAFENFELRERFYDGQKSVFGITRRTPQELGLTP